MWRFAPQNKAANEVSATFCRTSEARPAERRCGSAADVHASVLAGTAARCCRLMARRVSAGTESGWQFAATMARRVASAPSQR